MNVERVKCSASLGFVTRILAHVLWADERPDKGNPEDGEREAAGVGRGVVAADASRAKAPMIPASFRPR